MPSIIDIDQTCSVKGRSIFDNVHLIRNVINYINQKDLSACFICLDQEKAFDRVSRSYMFNTLTAFGFHENFLKWIHFLYNNISSSVIINNYNPLNAKRYHLTFLSKLGFWHFSYQFYEILDLWKYCSCISISILRYKLKHEGTK